jgi:hypothetical protein
VKASEMHRDSYPEDWFPQVSRKRAEAVRAQLMAEVGELPTGVLKQVLAEARKHVAQSVNGLAGSQGRERSR